MTLYPWLKPVVDDFNRQLSQDRHGHGYLVELHQGYGAFELIDLLAKAALCLTPSVNGYCGHCKACLLAAAGNHPDFYVIEAADRQIKVDQIRDLCRRLTSTAQQGGQRIAVIKNCERLTVAAANALLKTLEEPGDDTLLFLQSDSPNRLMATIRSRCQRLHCRLPAAGDIQQWLAQQYSVKGNVTWCLPVVGGPVELLAALQGERYAQLIEYRRQWMQSLSSGHLCIELTKVDTDHIIDVLKVLYLVLRHRLLKQQNADGLLNVKITTFAAKVMETCHKINLMPTVNIAAILQSFMVEYRSLTNYN